MDQINDVEYIEDVVNDILKDKDKLSSEMCQLTCLLNTKELSRVGLENQFNQLIEYIQKIVKLADKAEAEEYLR